MPHTDGKTGAPAGPVMHVGLVCGRGMLTSAERSSIGRQLQRIAKQHGNHLLVLHHGCGNDGDEVAHRAVQVLGKWDIHGHPASAPPSGEVLLKSGVIRGLSRIYESKTPRQCYDDIVDISSTLLVVAGREMSPDIEAAVERAQESHRNVIYIPGNTKVRKPPSVWPSLSPRPSPAVPGQRDPAWAARQGRRDGIAGKFCPKYIIFLRTYQLDKCDESLELWRAYLKGGQQPRASAPTPKSKKQHRQGEANARKSTPASKRKAVPKPVGKGRGDNGLSPKNAAMLMKLNQQNTLVDMWR